MAVPDFQSFFKPLLDLAIDGKVHSIQEARDYINGVFKLSDEDMKDALPSGNQTRFDNRVAWAKSYFIQAKIISSPQRGYFEITKRGQKLHLQGHKRIDKKVLSQYPEFVSSVHQNLGNLIISRILVRIRRQKRYFSNHM